MPERAVYLSSICLPPRDPFRSQSQDKSPKIYSYKPRIVINCRKVWIYSIVQPSQQETGLLPPAIAHAQHAHRQWPPQCPGALPPIRPHRHLAIGKIALRQVQALEHRLDECAIMRRRRPRHLHRSNRSCTARQLMRRSWQADNLVVYPPQLWAGRPCCLQSHEVVGRQAAREVERDAAAALRRRAALARERGASRLRCIFFVVGRVIAPPLICAARGWRWR